MQTTHLQQPDHILKFKRAAHQTQHVGVKRKSNAECEGYVMVFENIEMIINNVKYIMTSK